VRGRAEQALPELVALLSGPGGAAGRGGAA
jgi:hypothetical protein